MTYPRRNKMGAKRTMFAGRTYASKAEAEYARYLDQLVSIGELKLVVPQPGTILLGVPENSYRPDFLCVTPDAKWWYTDVKGMLSTAFKKNLKLWASYGPGELRVVKRSGKGWKTTETVTGPNCPLRTVVVGGDA